MFPGHKAHGQQRGFRTQRSWPCSWPASRQFHAWGGRGVHSGTWSLWRHYPPQGHYTKLLQLLSHKVYTHPLTRDTSQNLYFPIFPKTSVKRSLEKSTCQSTQEQQYGSHPSESLVQRHISRANSSHTLLRICWANCRIVLPPPPFSVQTSPHWHEISPFTLIFSLIFLPSVGQCLCLAFCKAHRHVFLGLPYIKGPRTMDSFLDSVAWSML